MTEPRHQRGPRLPPRSVSIVIAVRNGRPHLKEQLASVVAQRSETPFEIIVVDNDSTDGTAGDVRGWMKQHENIRLVSAAEGRGKQYAFDVGVRSATGELLISIDHDDVCAPGWLSGFLTVAYAGDILAGALNVEALNSLAAISARPWISTDPIRISLGVAPYAAGCNMAIWRDAYDLVAPRSFLDAEAEDKDLGFRALIAHLCIVPAPEAIVYYRLRPPGADLRRQMRRYGQGDAALVSRYRHLGARGDSLIVGLRKWLFLAPRAAKAYLEADDAHWSRSELAVAIGRLQGSLRYRALCL